MANKIKTCLSASEQIGVLFKEYDTLRAEMVGRISGAHQSASVVAIVVGAMLSWLSVSSHHVSAGFWIAASCFAFASVTYIYSLYRDIGILCRRVRALETRINELAGTILLTWENDWGGTNGWFWRKWPPREPDSGGN